MSQIQAELRAKIAEIGFPQGSQGGKSGQGGKYAKQSPHKPSRQTPQHKDKHHQKPDSQAKASTPAPVSLSRPPPSKQDKQQANERHQHHNKSNNNHRNHHNDNHNGKRFNDNTTNSNQYHRRNPKDLTHRRESEDSTQPTSEEDAEKAAQEKEENKRRLKSAFDALDTSVGKWWERTVVLPDASSKIQSKSQGKKMKFEDEEGEKHTSNNKAETPRRTTPLPGGVDECYAHASSLLTSLSSTSTELTASSSSNASASDRRFLQTVLTSGTLSDKIAGMTLLVQEDPVSRLPVLEKLLAFAQKQGRREASLAIDALKDLFVNDLLPPRRLYVFAQQPYFVQLAERKKREESERKAKERGKKVTSTADSLPILPEPTDSELIQWRAEEELKKYYAQFLAVLEAGTHDEMAYIKRQRIQALYDLLCNCAERERIILSLLINKLGDPDRNISAYVIKLLNELITIKHPGMKLAVITEIENYIQRNKDKDRNVYIAIIFLNQFIFLKGEEIIAFHLLTVYFGLFKTTVLNHQPKPKDAEKSGDKNKKTSKKKKKFDKKHKKNGKKNGSNTETFESKEEAMHAKLLCAILTGVNRALPYAGILDNISAQTTVSTSDPTTPSATTNPREFLFSQIDLLFSLIHHTTLPTAIQALMLLYQVCVVAAQKNPDAAISSSPNQEDSFETESSHKGPAPKVHTPASLTDRFYRVLYELLLHPDLQQSTTRHGLFLNLLFKALKNDPALSSSSSSPSIAVTSSSSSHNPSTTRVVAFLKRLLQLSVTSPSAPFICASLYLFSEVLKQHSSLFSQLVQPEEKGRVMLTNASQSTKLRTDMINSVNQSKRDEDEENFKDVDDEDEAEQLTKAKKEQDLLKASDAHADTLPTGYDPFKREPMWSRANMSCFWELSVLSRHEHPSVSKFATTILTSTAGQAQSFVHYNGDPLMDFTLMAFLDRFVFKNPKKTTEDEEKAIKRQLNRTTITDEERENLKNNLIMHQRRQKFTRGLSASSSSLHKNDSGLDMLTPTPTLNKTISSDLFLKKDISQVADDELFFHQYFKQKANIEEKKGIVRPKKEDEKTKRGKNRLTAEEAEEAEEDEFAQQIIEEEMRKMAGGVGPDDDDIDIEDYDYSSEEEQGDGEADADADDDGFEGLEDLVDDDEEVGEDDEEQDGDEEDGEAMDDDEAAVEALFDKKKTKKGAQSMGSFDEEDEDDDGLDALDLEDEEFDDEEDEDEDEGEGEGEEEDDGDKKGKQKRGSVPAKKGSNASVFASAEEFADILNENWENGPSKQDKWEEKRAGNNGKRKSAGSNKGFHKRRRK